MDLFQWAQMGSAIPFPSPMVSSVGPALSAYVRDPVLNPTSYHFIVGAFQYVPLTWPDIAYSVNRVCQFM